MTASTKANIWGALLAMGMIFCIVEFSLVVAVFLGSILENIMCLDGGCTPDLSIWWAMLLPAVTCLMRLTMPREGRD